VYSADVQHRLEEDVLHQVITFVRGRHFQSKIAVQARNEVLDQPTPFPLMRVWIAVRIAQHNEIEVHVTNRKRTTRVNGTIDGRLGLVLGALCHRRGGLSGQGLERVEFHRPLP
jgi:hypothetical protein